MQRIVTTVLGVEPTHTCLARRLVVGVCAVAVLVMRVLVAVLVMRVLVMRVPALRVLGVLRAAVHVGGEPGVQSDV